MRILRRKPMIKNTDDALFTGTQLLEKPSANSKPHEYKVCVLGGEKVGKTSILSILVNNRLLADYEYQPTIAETYDKDVYKNDKHVASFTFFDTSGIDFPAMTKLTLTKSDACVIVFSLSCAKSFRVAERKMRDVRTAKPNDFPCIVVGNKLDDASQRALTYDKCLTTAAQHGCSYVEVSAKTGQNMQDVFTSLVRKINSCAFVKSQLDVPRRAKKKSEFGKRYLTPQLSRERYTSIIDLHYMQTKRAGRPVSVSW